MKTAYDMRISDWSSDVCSSDLCLLQLELSVARRLVGLVHHHDVEVGAVLVDLVQVLVDDLLLALGQIHQPAVRVEAGRQHVAAAAQVPHEAATTALAHPPAEVLVGLFRGKLLQHNRKPDGSGPRVTS